VDEDVWNEDEDAGNGDEKTTIPCPYCRHPIHDESQRCPYCGEYILEEDAVSPTNLGGSLLGCCWFSMWFIGG
jgi:DNA-directed RNA polymerase subunit RPC12/RpoP